MIWEGRKGEAQAGYSRAELQLQAGDVSTIFTRCQLRKPKTPHPYHGHLFVGSRSAPARPAPTPRSDPHFLSKAMSHREASPRALVRCFPCGTHERSPRSDPDCQVHLKTQTAAFSFPILKCKGPQNPGESPGLPPTPIRSQWASCWPAPLENDPSRGVSSAPGQAVSAFMLTECPGHSAERSIFLLPMH